MSKGFNDFIEAARQGAAAELEVAETAGSPDEFAAGARGLGYDVDAAEVHAYATRTLTDEEAARVAGGGADTARRWPLSIFP